MLCQLLDFRNFWYFQTSRSVHRMGLKATWYVFNSVGGRYGFSRWRRYRPGRTTTPNNICATE